IPVVIAPATPPMTPARQAAMALMLQVRELEKAGNLVEARDKAVTAQRLNADFAPGEDRPEVALMELNQKGVRKINEMIAQALAAAGAQPTSASASLAQSKLN